MSMKRSWIVIELGFDDNVESNINVNGVSPIQAMLILQAMAAAMEDIAESVTHAIVGRGIDEAI